MMDFLNIFGMLGTYDQRVVANYVDEATQLQVDTAEVYDSDQPYETAVSHPAYNDGKWVIVEMYDSKQEAQDGHDRWVKAMTTKELPERLQDVSTASIVELAKALFGDEEVRERFTFKKEGDNV